MMLSKMIFERYEERRIDMERQNRVNRANDVILERPKLINEMINEKRPKNLEDQGSMFRHIWQLIEI
jgi:hypothetical protein